MCKMSLDGMHGSHNSDWLRPLLVWRRLPILLIMGLRVVAKDSVIASVKPMKNGIKIRSDLTL